VAQLAHRRGDDQAGLLALTVGTAMRPERRAQREAAQQAQAGALPGT